MVNPDESFAYEDDSFVNLIDIMYGVRGTSLVWDSFCQSYLY